MANTALRWTPCWLLVVAFLSGQKAESILDGVILKAHKCLRHNEPGQSITQLNDAICFWVSWEEVKSAEQESRWTQVLCSVVVALEYWPVCEKEMPEQRNLITRKAFTWESSSSGFNEQYALGLPQWRQMALAPQSRQSNKDTSTTYTTPQQRVLGLLPQIQMRWSHFNMANVLRELPIQGKQLSGHLWWQRPHHPPNIHKGRGLAQHHWHLKLIVCESHQAHHQPCPYRWI